jgi:hypothetical protein
MSAHCYHQYTLTWTSVHVQQQVVGLSKMKPGAQAVRGTTARVHVMVQYTDYLCCVLMCEVH